MSSFVSKKRDRVTVAERPDEWIDLKARLSIRDRATFQDAILTTEFQKGDDGAKVSMAAGQLTYKMLELSIVDWALVNDDGQPVPFNPAMIGELDQEDALVDAAIQRVVELNPTLSGQKESDG